MKILVSFIVLFFACSTSESIVEKLPSSDLSISTNKEINDNDEIQSQVETNTISETLVEYPYLSNLSDTYFNRLNTIPEGYSKIKSEIEAKEVDLFEGFRVQIFSGQNPALADTVAKRFRAWSAASIDGYQAETYTFFKAPYYRVHIGDFHNRNKAIQFSNLLKRRFRDSWVVYDRVNPYNIPADSISITLVR